MSNYKAIDAICGYPEEILIRQTPQICRSLMTSSCLSHKNESVKKWMNYLGKLLEKEQKRNKQKHKKHFINNVNLNKIWSLLCLLSTSYKIIDYGYIEWNKHFDLIFNLLENPSIFYHLILRKRCFQTLCQIIKYSQCITNDTNCHQLSLQSTIKFIKHLQEILFEIVLKKDNNFNDSKLLKNILLTLHKLLSNTNLGSNYLNTKIKISLINRSCFHCLMSNDNKIRSIAIGMFYSFIFFLIT